MGFEVVKLLTVAAILQPNRAKSMAVGRRSFTMRQTSSPPLVEPRLGITWDNTAGSSSELPLFGAPGACKVLCGLSGSDSSLVRGTGASVSDNGMGVDVGSADRKQSPAEVPEGPWSKAPSSGIGSVTQCKCQEVRARRGRAYRDTLPNYQRSPYHQKPRWHVVKYPLVPFSFNSGERQA